jgi:beta-lactam-binding protein with PASTA domain
MGLDASQTNVQSSATPRDVVISQTPAGGLKVPRGSVVKLVISEGPTP